MTPFEFVSVFFSVMLGLAVARLMDGVSELVEARTRVRGYWVQGLWMVNVYVALAQSWWGTWELRHAAVWSFVSYFIVVLYFAMLFLLTSLLLPRIADRGEVDLGEHFFLVRRIFFLVLAAVTALAVLMNVSLFGARTISPETLIPASFLVLSCIGAWTGNRRYHAVFALYFAIAIAAFLVADGLSIG